jgi:hypothetical protein
VSILVRRFSNEFEVEMSNVNINVSTSETVMDMAVTAAAGGSGTAIPITDQTVSMSFGNLTDGQPFEYKVGSGEWQVQSGRGSFISLDIDLSTETVYLRMSWPGSTSVPVHVVATVVSGVFHAEVATIAGGGGGGGATSFTELTDAPGSYTGKAGAVPVVNEAETGLSYPEFLTLTPGTKELSLQANGASVCRRDRRQVACQFERVAGAVGRFLA